MLILGHVGLTLGTATLLAGAHRSNRFSLAMWVTSLGSYIDIRLLMVGSLLPDIIDKPVGQFFFRETFSQGRMFSHTLLFLILVTLGGLYLYYRRSRVWLLTLSFGTFSHLIFDQMWRTPQTLFWPLYGFTFARTELAEWIPGILSALLTSPQVYLPELGGAMILLWFGLILIRRKKVYAFIRYGQVR